MKKNIYVLNCDYNTQLKLNPKTNKYTIAHNHLHYFKGHQEAFDTAAVLYCKDCSFNGKVQAEQFEKMKQTKKTMQFSIVYRCPLCKEKANRHFLVNTNEWVDSFYTGRSKTHPNIHAFQFKYWKAYEKKGKFRLFSAPYRFSFNEKTGLLYLIHLQKRKIKTVLWSSIFDKKDELALNSLMASKRNIDYLDEYFANLMNIRGITYVSFAELKGATTRDFHARYKQVLLYLRYPALQNVPPRHWGVFSPIMRKKLTHFTGGATEFYQLMFPISSKSSAKRADFMISSLHYMSHFIKDPSEYHRFLQVVMNWEKKHAYQTSNDIIFDYDETRWYQSFKWFYKHCKNDRLFVNRILRVCPFTEEMPEEAWVYGLKHHLMDAYDMYRKLKEADPLYQAPKETEMKRLHDLLADDYNRMKKENKVIPYQEKEKMLQVDFDDYSFKLAEDTHELITFGSAMDICVGSYDDKVLEKTSTIVWMTQPKKEIPDVCIEILPKENNTFMLSQAKLAHNEFPSGDVRDRIITWCKKNKIQWKKCYDLAT